jgi:hypothetical protein
MWLKQNIYVDWLSTNDKNYIDNRQNLLIENKQIQQVNKSQTLGTTIDQHLSWKPNTENICKNIS